MKKFFVWLMFKIFDQGDVWFVADHLQFLRRGGTHTVVPFPSANFMNMEAHVQEDYRRQFAELGYELWTRIPERKYLAAK